MNILTSSFFSCIQYGIGGTTGLGSELEGDTDDVMAKVWQVPAGTVFSKAAVVLCTGGEVTDRWLFSIGVCSV